MLINDLLQMLGQILLSITEELTPLKPIELHLHKLKPNLVLLIKLKVFVRAYHHRWKSVVPCSF